MSIKITQVSSDDFAKLAAIGDDVIVRLDERRNMKSPLMLPAEAEHRTDRSSKCGVAVRVGPERNDIRIGQRVHFRRGRADSFAVRLADGSHSVYVVLRCSAAREPIPDGRSVILAAENAE